MPRVYDPQLRGFNKSVVQIMGLLMEKKKKNLSLYICVLLVLEINMYVACASTIAVVSASSVAR